MPRIYDRNCDSCGKHYRGIGEMFCSKSCKTRDMNPMLSEVSRKKIGVKNSIHMKNLHKTNLNSHNKALANLKQVGDKHWNWRGGITQIERRARSTKKYKLWREMVYVRDNYTCQFCLIRGGHLEAHHIKPFGTFPEFRYDINNGVTLCRSCHLTTQFSLGRIKYSFRGVPGRLPVEMVGGFREPQVPGIGLTGQFTTAEYNQILAALSGGGLSTFADAETPSGTIDGTNPTFTLAHTPASGCNPLVVVQGQVQQNSGDFTISSATITFSTIPSVGMWILVWYRY